MLKDYHYPSVILVGLSLKLVSIAGDTYYFPGMTNIGVYRDYVIDPGKNERVDWQRPESTFGKKIAYGLITHCHDDHFWHAADLRNSGAKIYAPASESPLIEDLEIHTRGFFLWVRPPDGMKPWYFRGTSCPVDGPVEELDMPLEIVPMHGHTDGQVGYMTPDGVLFVADAMVAKDVWDTAGIFYFTNIPDTRRTLNDLMNTDADWVLPTHTGLLTREEAVELADVNLKGLDRLERVVLDAIDKDGSSVESIVSKACLSLDMKDEFSVHLVGETAVRAFLHALYESRSVDYELKGHKVIWRIA
jgi:glyoxylase-like metal-dependent hydrolase (beta-lactamase superfamily II)